MTKGRPRKNYVPSLKNRRIKVIVSLLRGRDYTLAELIKETRFPWRSVRRYKDDLLAMGLIEFKDDRIIWCERSRVLNPAELSLYLDHSRKLIPALKSIIEMTSADENPSQPYAEEHLKGYPEIYQKLSKFRELQRTQTGKVYEKIKGKIKTPDKMWTLHYEKRRTKSFVGRVFGEAVLVKDDIPYYIGPLSFEELKELEDYLVPSSVFRVRKDYYIRGPIQIAMLDEMFELYRGIAGYISELILRIEHGTPLEGACSICPRVKIVERDVKGSGRL